MNYQDPYDRPRPDAFWEDAHGTPPWAKVVAVLILATGIGAAIAIFVSRSGGSEPVAKVVTVKKTVARPAQEPAQSQGKAALPEATRGPGHGGSPGGGGFLGSEADASFEALASSLPASVGLAVQPLGGGETLEFGALREGEHAWSSIKVPILATVLREQGESLGPEEESWAESAITASDNEAAAALFGKIEERHGGLDGASAAVGETLHAGGSTGTEVATAPPPPGAVSTYGQTEWSVGEAAHFFAALGRCEVLDPQGTEYVESLMEDVIPEQRWGLGEATFPSGWRVGMKGGWGPEAESGGGYLVRQSGLVRDADGGVAVAMVAVDDSGSYPAGAADLTQIAQWLAGELKGLGPHFSACAG
jgi:hypothetical protein